MLNGADVRDQVRVSIFTDFEQNGTFKPAAFQEGSVNSMLDQVISWSSALRVLRDK